ncbi:MAG: ABC transporter substrate-binding protein [Lachnospiraceae bacterium]|nr:ABC transporter substrate-binding protein [Lachnospiraceae bacterium]
MKNLKKIVSMMVMLAMLLSVLTACSKAGKTDVNVGVLKGPTGIGAVSIMDKSDKGEYDKYHFTLSAEAPDIVAKLSNGDLDIGALPTNVALNLYNKTNGGVKMIAINCLGVLYILENGNSVNSLADLKGRTIYMNGQGSNPEFVMNYLLRQAGLEPGEDVDVQFKDPSEISAMMISGEADLCMLPVPAATAILMKNPDVRKAVDMTKAYDEAANNGSKLTMGCLVATQKFIDEHEAEIELFLERYQKSIEFVTGSIDEAAALVAQYEITGNDKIAKNAIPDCSIVCITGKDMKPAIEGYYKVLFDADAKSVGGSMPGDDFYYSK